MYDNGHPVVTKETLLLGIIVFTPFIAYNLFEAGEYLPGIICTLVQAGAVLIGIKWVRKDSKRKKK